MARIACSIKPNSTRCRIDRATRLRAQQAVGELIYLLYHHAAPFTSIDQPRAIVGE